MKEIPGAVQNLPVAYIELLPAVKILSAAIGILSPTIAKRADRMTLAGDIFIDAAAN